MQTTEKKRFIDEFKNQWRSMWRDRVDDKTRAEGIADRDYSLLSVDRGTVIIATKKFKPLDFCELLQQHRSLAGSEAVPQNPCVGGWGKFIKTVLHTQNLKRGRRQAPPRPDKHAGQQLKKGGRGWLHFER